MQIKTSNNSTLVSDNLVVSTVSVNEKKLDLISQHFRDNIYSDKIMAPIRELISNAIDEHNLHKIDKAVEVKIYRDDRAYRWSVRDFALGLDENGIRNVLGMYFESTKDRSNASIGGFGVGAKSFFVVTDNATIISHFKGIKSTYIAFLDRGQSGVGVGKITKISEEPTSEQGLEINFEIQDKFAFEKKTSEFLHRTKPTTKITFTSCGISVFSRFPTISRKVGNAEIFAHKRHESYRYQEPNVLIRMGDVCYPIEPRIRDKFTKYFKSDVIIDVPIGTFVIPISRESIAICPQNEKILKELIEKVEEDYNQQYKAATFSLVDLGAYDLFFGIYYKRNPHQITNLVCFPKPTEKILVTIENNYAHSTWRKRLEKWARSNANLDKDVHWVSLKKGEVFSPECILESHTLKSVKSLKLPPLHGKTEIVYTFTKPNNSYRTLRWSLSEFEQECPLEDLDDIKEIEDLQNICVSDSSNRHSWRVCKTAVKALRKKGYFDPEDPLVVDKRIKILKAAREAAELSRVISQVANNKILSSKTRKILLASKDAKNAKRIEEAITKLKKKNEMTRIVFELYMNNSANRSPSRIEIKKVLKNLSTKKTRK